MPSIFAISERNKGPVCECDSWRCMLPLGITWEEHARLSGAGALPIIAAGCLTPRSLAAASPVSVDPEGVPHV